MHPKTGFLVLLVATVTAGCMFHGDTPIAQAPASFSVDNTANPVKSLPEYPWWSEVGSSELNELVLEALENNKQVNIASKNIEAAQISLDTVRLGWLPTINLLGGPFKSEGIAIVPNLPVPLAGTGSFFAFLPNWVVNIIQLPNQTKAAEKNVEVSVADYLALRNSVAAQVVSSYATVLASIEEERILAELTNNLNVRVKTIRSMAVQGLATQISMIEQDSQVQKLASQVAINRANKIAAKNALLTLLGRPLEDFKPKDSFSRLNLDYIAPGNTPTSVLATRPDVAAARAKIQAADYGISATASLFAPTPILSSATVRLSADIGNMNTTFSENVQMGMVSWALDPQFIGKIRSANKQYDSALINYLSVVDNAIKDVDNALADFDAKQTTLIKEQEILSNSNKNLKTFRAMRSNGLLSETQYLQSAAQFDLANSAIVQTKLQAIISFSKLYQSMGGGAAYDQKSYSLQDQSIVSIDRGDSQSKR
jgi:outer membrane protein, multidrug efflux system